MTKGNFAYQEAVKHGAQSAVFLDAVNMRYITGFAASSGAAVCFDGGVGLLLDMRYAAAAETEGGLREEVAVVRCTDPPITALKLYLEGKGIKKTLLDSACVTVDLLERLKKDIPGVDFVCAANICGEIRKIKDETEIENIKNARSVTDRAFSHILDFIQSKRNSSARFLITEREVAAEIEYFMRKNGADGPAFDTIAVSGLKSALPHGTPGDDILTENAFLTMDFGAKYKGYCFDMTRTVVIGRADGRMKRIYETVLKAQSRALAAIRDGALCRDVDSAARDYIAFMGYGDNFSHSTGHSLGLEIHEVPSCSSKSEDVLKAGMLMTVEPGIYIEGFGGVRIEDTVLVTREGCENLTLSKKELIEI